MNKVITVKIPPNIREWTDDEKTYLTNVRFKKKLFPNISLTADRYIRTVISIIESNPNDSNGYVHIPIDYLGKVFKSQQMAQDVMDFLLVKAVKRNSYYNKDAGISRGYRLTDGFKTINLMKNIKKDDNLTPNDENLTSNDENQLTEEMELEEDVRKVRKIVEKYNTKGFHNKITNIGLDPSDSKICYCCGNDIPLYLFFVSPNKTLYKKCAICIELEKLDDSDFVIDAPEFLTKWNEWMEKKQPWRKNVRLMSLSA